MRLRLRVRVGVTWYERLAYALKDIGSVHLLSEMKNHEMGTWRGWGGQGGGEGGGEGGGAGWGEHWGER